MNKILPVYQEHEEERRKRIPLKIWVSLEGKLKPGDLVVDNNGKDELVLSISENRLETISRADKTPNIDYNVRLLLGYALFVMKPKIKERYHSESHDFYRKKLYEHYNQILSEVEK